MEPPEILRRVAVGRIPISFDMHESEVTSLHRPPTFYIMAPRQSYLPLVARSARESFEEAAPDVGASGVWFEHDGKPLRWNIPIGVLFDFHRSSLSVSSSSSSSQQSTIINDDLPFKITIRFQGFPKTNLLPCAGEIDAENAFFNSMKQALCLRFGSAKGLMEMPKSNQENLWEGIVFGKFEKYWQSCGPLLSTVDQMDSQHQTPQVPIRVLLRADDISLEGGARVLQASVPLIDETLTLKDAIATVLKSNGRDPDEEDWMRIRVSIQGVAPPLSSFVKEICDEMCSHDLFLYVVVFLPSK